jgi:hypothetical protein
MDGTKRPQCYSNTTIPRRVRALYVYVLRPPRSGPDALSLMHPHTPPIASPRAEKGEVVRTNEEEGARYAMGTDGGGWPECGRPRRPLPRAPPLGLTRDFSGLFTLQ